MTADKIAEVELEIEKAREARESAQADYRSFLQAEDMAAVRGARDAMRRYDDQIEVLSDRLDALRKDEQEQAQRVADKKLAQALKRAEAASKAERMTAAGLGEIVEHLRTLKADLEDKGREAARATHAAYAAADAAGRPRPNTGRSILKADAETTEARKLVAEIGRMLDMQESAVVAATGERRKAG